MHRDLIKLDCLFHPRSGKFEQYRGCLILCQNIGFTFIISAQVWVLIDEQRNNEKFEKNWNLKALNMKKE